MNKPSYHMQIHSPRSQADIVIHHGRQSGHARSRRLGHVSVRYVRAILRLPLYGVRIVMHHIAGPPAWQRIRHLPVPVGTGPMYIPRGPERVKAVGPE